MTSVIDFAVPMLVLYLFVTVTCRFMVPPLFVDKMPRAPILLRTVWANQVMTFTALFYTACITFEHPLERTIAFVGFLGFSINTALAVYSKKNIKKVEKFANGEISAPPARSTTD